MKIPIFENLRPSNSHRIKVTKTLKKLSKVFKIPFNLFGSLAKDTSVGNHKELDLFFKGPSLEQTMRILKETISNHFSFYNLTEKRMGHPYYSVSYKNLGVNWTLDLVPYIGIKGSSDVERSMLHVDWIITEIEKKNLNTDHVRYIKVLLKQYELYGAESSIEGLSGYAVQVLCHNSTTIEDLLIKAKKNILIDPVDSDRNLFSSLSPHNHHRLILLLKNLKTILKNKPFDKPVGKLYCLKAESFKNQLKEQTRKRMKFIVKELEKTNYYYGSYWSCKDQVLYLLLENWFYYAETTEIKDISPYKTNLLKDFFYEKNKSFLNISNIGVLRIVKKKKINLDSYLLENNLKRIPLTKKLKNNFLKLSLSY